MSESQNIEWKESWRDEYFKWICGYANAQGGKLLIGVDDNGVVLGISNAKELLEKLPNQVRQFMGILVDVNLLEEDDKEYLEIVVDPYPYPISYKGKYHYRSGSTKQELRGAALDRFLLQKQGKHWDGVPVPNVTVDDLSGGAFDYFRAQAEKSKRVSEDVLEESNASLIDNLHLTEGEYLKRAAVLLFHPDPERFVTAAYVKIGFFESDSELRYQDEVHGNLFEQVNKTTDLLLTKYMKAEIRYDGVNRIEEYPFPEAALREALLNAIAHKDYSSGSPIQISVYENKIMFWNDGQLPENWTIDKLMKKHPSQPYNPDVANTFFRAGLIESWGRGVDVMVQACREYDSPEPVLRYEDSGFWVEFLGRNMEKTTQKSSEKGSEKSSEKILNIMRVEPHISAKHIAEQLGLSSRAVEKQISQLKKQGQLIRVGSAKGGCWKVLSK